MYHYHQSMYPSHCITKSADTAARTSLLVQAITEVFTKITNMTRPRQTRVIQNLSVMCVTNIDTRSLSEHQCYCCCSLK